MIATYLSVVIAMMARDYRVQQRGRWRPSAAARKVGIIAVRLESLIYRSRYSLSEAGNVLRSSGETSLSDRDLANLLTRLPARQPLRPVIVGSDSLADGVLPSAATADASTAFDEDQQARSAVEQAVEECLATFSAEDRLILRLRFWDDLSVAEVARMVGLEQKPLYRRIDRLLANVRSRLLKRGVCRESVAAMLAGIGE